jgi:hypothetical protein
MKRTQPLGQEHIRADLAEYLGERFDNRLDLYCYAFGTELSAALILWVFINRWWAWLLPVPFVLCTVFFLVRRIRLLRAQKASVALGDYVIRTSSLLNIGYEIIHEVWMGRRHVHHAKEVQFYYFTCGKWRTPARCYRWSELYKMSRRGLENTSLLGDEFYVVIYEGEICAAYNTKFFDLEE